MYALGFEPGTSGLKTGALTITPQGLLSTLIAGILYITSCFYIKLKQIITFASLASEPESSVSVSIDEK